MMKFRVTLDIAGEPLIRLLARYAPFEITGVEEVVEQPAVRTEQATASVKALKKPKGAARGRAVKGVNLHTGVNGVMMTILSDGQPHRAVEMKGPLKAAGFSENSVGSRMQALRDKGLVEQIGNGQWRLTDKTVQIP
jgi:hypothetical protein